MGAVRHCIAAVALDAARVLLGSAPSERQVTNSNDDPPLPSTSIMMPVTAGRCAIMAATAILLTIQTWYNYSIHCALCIAASPSCAARHPPLGGVAVL